MTGYGLAQWVLYFFIYSFLGWVWESCLVSVQQHRWVNRGFLNGPFLPIYGFGAVAILLFTWPVQNNTLLVFAAGMLGATLLEYVTGYRMEKLFHVRYWDYSRFRWNLNGYICVVASLCWGVFSILLVRVLQPPVAGLVRGLSPLGAGLLALVLALGMTADLIVSMREAMDMRSLLNALSESKRRIARLQKRLEMTAAFTQLDWEQSRQAEAVRSAKKGFAQRLQALREERKTLLRMIAARLEEMRFDRRRSPERLESEMQILKSELRAMESRTDKMYQRAARHLRRNPYAVSRKHGEAMQDMKNLLRDE